MKNLYYKSVHGKQKYRSSAVTITDKNETNVVIHRVRLKRTPKKYEQ